MRFSEFQAFRERLAQHEPALLDAAETNVYRALGSLRPEPAAPDTTVHRCDLARAWLQRFGLPAELSRQALVCQGVRHGLGLIFAWLRAERAVLWLPSDVYPVYFDLAHAAGLTPAGYRTLPEPDLPAARAGDRPEYLLVANPWKPLGRFLTDVESAALVAWLEQSPRRRVLIDSVYDMGTPFHPSTRRLLDTGQAVLLHSVTKGWLWPRAFGVVLWGNGADNVVDLAAAVRAQPPTQERLSLAAHLLADHADVPQRIAGELAERAERLFARLPSAVRAAIPASAAACRGNYFFPVDVPPAVLQHEHGVLALPASVFGSTTWSGSILTSLSGAFAAPSEGAA